MPLTANEEEAYKLWLEHVENELREFDINKLSNGIAKHTERTTVLK